MSTNPFNRIDAPGFTNEATTCGLKVLDKLNLFDHDDIVAAFPFGKAIQGAPGNYSRIQRPTKSRPA